MRERLAALRDELAESRTTLASAARPRRAGGRDRARARPPAGAAARRRAGHVGRAGADGELVARDDRARASGAARMSGGRSRSTTRSPATGPTSCSRISAIRSCGWRWRCCAPRCGAPATICTASRFATPHAEPGRAGRGRARPAGDHRRERPPAARAADLRRGAADRRAPGAARGRRTPRRRSRSRSTRRSRRSLRDQLVPRLQAQRRRAAGGAAGARRRPRPPADRDAGRPCPARSRSTSRRR